MNECVLQNYDQCLWSINLASEGLRSEDYWHFQNACRSPCRHFLLSDDPGTLYFLDPKSTLRRCHNRHRVSCARSNDSDRSNRPKKHHQNDRLGTDYEHLIFEDDVASRCFQGKICRSACNVCYMVKLLRMPAL